MKDKKLIRATGAFVAVSIILGLYYYITFYRESVLGLFAAGPFLRALDSVSFYAMGFCWVRLIDAITASNSRSFIVLRRITNVTFIVLMICSAIIYVCLLDEFYSTEVYWQQVIAIISEAVLGTAVFVFTCIYVVLAFRELNDRYTRTYITLVSIGICFNTIWNNTVVVLVFIEAIDVNNIFCSQLYAVTSILLLIINLLTLIYVYKKDFTPLYFTNTKIESERLTEEQALNEAAAEHRLTEREREVMIEAYYGRTNPEIADKLCISKYTVKRHMHNIFEKMDVATRMELIHVVKSKMG
ncbi:MAG: helix-turn-helix transcriptional regulator [Firmicutes bacterium]|nr:helix-turn-helix transcriptional regulator [Bacillota bacterium]